MRSYELFARYVLPHFHRMLDPLRASYEAVAATSAATAASPWPRFTKAFEDAGKPRPDDVTTANRR